MTTPNLDAMRGGVVNMSWGDRPKETILTEQEEAAIKVLYVSLAGACQVGEIEQEKIIKQAITRVTTQDMGVLENRFQEDWSQLLKDVRWAISIERGDAESEREAAQEEWDALWS